MKKNQLSIDYGKCGDFHRKDFGRTDTIELNLTFSHSVSKNGIVSVGFGESYINLNNLFSETGVSENKETGFHSLVDYLYIISNQHQYSAFLETAFHKMISTHFK